MAWDVLQVTAVGCFLGCGLEWLLGIVSTSISGFCRRWGWVIFSLTSWVWLSEVPKSVGLEGTLELGLGKTLKLFFSLNPASLSARDQKQVLKFRQTLPFSADMPGALGIVCSAPQNHNQRDTLVPEVMVRVEFCQCETKDASVWMQHFLNCCFDDAHQVAIALMKNKGYFSMNFSPQRKHNQGTFSINHMHKLMNID